MDGNSIHLLRQPCVRIRDQRALVDTSLLRIRQLWSRYYFWLARKFGHPDLGHYGKRLFGWRYRVQLAVEQFKVAVGFGPKILR
jgi:hypothetical protein